MDPCPFFRIRVGSLALKLPTPTSSLFYCKIKLAGFPLQTTSVPVFAPDAASATASASACFTLSKPDLHRLQSQKKKSPGLSLSIDVYRATSKDGAALGCGIGFGSRSGKFVGRVCLVLDLAQVGLTGLLHNGWVPIADAKSSAELYVSLNLDPDPRFVFEFDGESECSPQVFQVQGNIKQPVFSCNFGFRNSGDWNNLRSGSSEPSSAKERKGWTVTIHDLSGSPVAAASMVTPFVASPGSGRVSRSNPGAWLILRPADGTWNPWGRLEAWSEGSSVAYRFEILSAAGGITLSTGEFSARSGGRFAVDVPGPFFNSPISTPSSSFDLGSWSGSECGSGSGSGSGWCWGPQWMYRGFVMSSTVGEERAQVQVGAQHVTCAEDAAVFVALAAAADLSVDACRPFSHRLRKELRPPTGEVVV